MEGDNLVIALKSSITNARFTYPIAEFKDGTGTAIEVVNLGGGSETEYTELTDFLSMTSYVEWGQNLVGVELATEGVSYTTDYSTWVTTYNGEGNYLKLELYSTDGTITAGTYQACTTGGTVGEGEFGIGYDGQWGASGTTWYTVSGGAASGTYITDGSITVEVDGDTYTIIIESSIINAKYVGTLTL